MVENKTSKTWKLKWKKDSFFFFFFFFFFSNYHRWAPDASPEIREVHCYFLLRRDKPGIRYLAQGSIFNNELIWFLDNELISILEIPWLFLCKLTPYIFLLDYILSELHPFYILKSHNYSFFIMFFPNILISCLKIP